MKKALLSIILLIISLSVYSIDMSTLAYRHSYKHESNCTFAVSAPDSGKIFVFNKDASGNCIYVNTILGYFKNVEEAKKTAEYYKHDYNTYFKDEGYFVYKDDYGKIFITKIVKESKELSKTEPAKERKETHGYDEGDDTSSKDNSDKFIESAENFVKQIEKTVEKIEEKLSETEKEKTDESDDGYDDGGGGMVFIGFIVVAFLFYKYF